jgi:hypothetical protein
MGKDFRDGSERKAHETKLAAKKFDKFISYLSVAIFMERMPIESEIEILTERAKKYASINKITITGFRIIKESKIINEETVLSILI